MLEYINKSEPRLLDKKKLLFFVSLFSLTLTCAGLLGALYFGQLYYDFRRNLLHEKRLNGILGEEPTVFQVTKGLEEKAPLVASPNGSAELAEVASRWSAKSVEILEKGARWTLTRVYDAGDMTYFIYFDKQDVMRDFVYVDNAGLSLDDVGSE
jgi:hypothetical protein